MIKIKWIAIFIAIFISNGVSAKLMLKESKGIYFDIEYSDNDTGFNGFIYNKGSNDNIVAVITAGEAKWRKKNTVRHFSNLIIEYVKVPVSDIELALEYSDVRYTSHGAVYVDKTKEYYTYTYQNVEHVIDNNFLWEVDELFINQYAKDILKEYLKRNK